MEEIKRMLDYLIETHSISVKDLAILLVKNGQAQSLRLAHSKIKDWVAMDILHIKGDLVSRNPIHRLKATYKADDFKLLEVYNPEITTMLDSLISTHPITIKDLIKLLLREGRVTSVRTARSRIKDWIAMDILYKWTDDYVCRIPIPKKRR